MTMVACPKCHHITNTDTTDTKYFLVKNSAGMLFFKCEDCGNLFYVNAIEGRAYSVSHGEKGHRFVPITWGIACWIIATGIFWLFGSNIITWILCGVLLLLGWSSIKIGIWGSQKLIDEMTLDRGNTGPLGLSKEAKEEFKKFR